MTQLSFPWPYTTGPQIGDGRNYTDAEWDEYFEAVHQGMHPASSGLLRCWNELVVTSPTANTLSVNTGKAMVKGKYFTNDAAVTLSPTSAGAGTVRYDSVILECDWTGGGGTGQYTVRLAYKQGSAAAYPTMTQTDNTLWQLRLYNYTISDTGAITGIVRACGFAEPGVVGWVPLGGIIMWSGTLDASHNPLIGGVADTAWHLCNGETVEGIITPDLRDRFIVGAGASYAVGNTGGSALLNLAHAHTNVAEASHTHAAGSIVAASESSHTHSVGMLFTMVQGGSSNVYHTDNTGAYEVSGTNHYHQLQNASTTAGTAHTHAMSGNSSAGSSHTHTMNSQLSAATDSRPPYYALAFLMRVK